MVAVYVLTESFLTLEIRERVWAKERYRLLAQLRLGVQGWGCSGSDRHGYGVLSSPFAGMRAVLSPSRLVSV